MSALSSVFIWLASHPAMFWTTAWTFLLLYVAASLLPAYPRGPLHATSRITYFAITFLALLAFRWPVLYHGMLNIDEAQIIAGAITFAHDPLPWRAVDLTSTGPLDAYVLLFPKLLGFPITFLTARVVGLVLLWGTLVSSYYSFRFAFSETVSRLCVLPLAAFYFFASHWDLVFYGSELLPVALAAISLPFLLHGLAYVQQNSHKGPWFLFLSGLCLGAMPYAKLQAVPIGLWMALFTYGSLALTTSTDWKKRAKAAAIFSIGGLFCTGGFLWIVVSNGLWHDFVQSYVVNNLAYVNTKISVRDFFRFLFVDSPLDFRVFAIPVCAYALLGELFLPWRVSNPRGRLLFLAAFGYVLAAFYSVKVPGRLFVHYLALLAPPLGLLSGTLFAAYAGHFRVPLAQTLARRVVSWSMVLLFFAACFVPQVIARSYQEQPYLGSILNHNELTCNPISRFILQIAPQHDTDRTMAVWGWMPLFYVETGIPQATRDAQTERQLLPGPQQQYYRMRFFKDLTVAKPPLFVDAVGPWSFQYTERDSYGYETFPELARCIAANYHLLLDEHGIRIFLRKDLRPGKP